MATWSVRGSYNEKKHETQIFTMGVCDNTMRQVGIMIMITRNSKGKQIQGSLRK